jgi:hypothetical protein
VYGKKNEKITNREKGGIENYGENKKWRNTR